MSTEFDPCPWDRDTTPTFMVEKKGHPCEPYIAIKVYCPKCKVGRYFHPSEKVIQEHYNSYSYNPDMIRAVLPDLAKCWNWK